MSYATDKWFQYLDEEILIEGLRSPSVGLPEVIIDRIEDTLSDVPEKGKVWIAKQWKDTRIWNLGVNPWDKGANEAQSEAFAQDFRKKLDYELEYAFPLGKSYLGSFLVRVFIQCFHPVSRCYL